jgi:hypothetical protein
MEAIFSSETSVDTQQTTQRFIPEDGTLDFFHSFSSKIDYKLFMPASHLWNLNVQCARESGWSQLVSVFAYANYFKSILWHIQNRGNISLFC